MSNTLATDSQHISNTLATHQLSQPSPQVMRSPVSRVVRSPCAGEALDPLWWTVPDEVCVCARTRARARSLSLSGLRRHRTGDTSGSRNNCGGYFHGDRYSSISIMQGLGFRQMQDWFRQIQDWPTFLVGWSVNQKHFWLGLGKP